MDNPDHYEGFERERTFHRILAQALCDCPVLKAKTVKRIIAQIDPNFTDGLFATRDCFRKLRYVGCGCEEEPCQHGPEYFEEGNIYESLTFTGATYTIKGYKNGNTRIGMEYFERVA
ncbi:MAG TPA: hypothetical protein PK200_08955 [Spirochaetota bacterium]|nr:hypothetical protein [Spirochaetota bacterium]